MAAHEELTEEGLCKTVVAGLRDLADRIERGEYIAKEATFDRPPEEVPTFGMWREYRPGPNLYMTLHLVTKPE